MWLGKELGEDFESPSNMRSVLETVVEDETSVGQLFEDLADRYRPIGEKVFRDRSFVPHVVVIINERVVSVYGLCDRGLQDGDQITVMPVYAGG
jgi:molybdopterin converting factor small subunit